MGLGGHALRVVVLNCVCLVEDDAIEIRGVNPWKLDAGILLLGLPVISFDSEWK